MERPGHAGRQGWQALLGRANGPAGLMPLGAQDPPRIGDYRLIGRLGEGGMGRVFLARSDRGRTVAVKLVRAELAGQEEFRARFRREVRAAQQVAGEWTAPVLDADTEAETPWLATGYIAGPSLQQVIGGSGTALPERTVRILAAGLARALESIHAAGIIHRDLKPSNVLLTIDGPRVIDFGIARALEAVSGNGVTHTGGTIGSPGFMSPEQVRGAPITPACDVFSLGAVLAYAATGRQPFGTADSVAHAVMFRIAQEEPDLSAVPEGMRGLIAGALAKDPEQRPTPAQLVAQAEGGSSDGDGPGADDEPWLPGALTARLGRHAVELLAAENPQNRDTARDGEPPTAVVPTPSAPGRAPAMAPPLSQGPAAYSPATTPHSDTASAPAPAGKPPRRRGAGTVLATAAALVLAGAGAVAAYALMSADGSGLRSADAAAGDAGGTGAQRTAGSTAKGRLPADYLGTWETTLGDSHDEVRRFTLRQGKAGDIVLTMTATGAEYRCEFAAALAHAGPPVRLGPSTVVSGPDGCSPGSPSTLEMVHGKLRRTSDDGKALTYRKLPSDKGS
ncbi:protein kinase [Streptomyces sp. NPDC015125]|uniref:serine/threonine-protein kinase n=1 Tax=Streptomyces sp. NPDC015125 TaxID=3364938 RepID=UPI0036F679AB